MNYFKLFNLPQIFNIDYKLLTKRFYKLQRKFHPDKLQGYSKLKKKEMSEQSIIINNGYQILKDSLKRAEYLLFLKGFDVHDKIHIPCNKSFLIKQFNLYEEIEKIKKPPVNIIRFNNTLARIKKIKKYHNNKLHQKLKEKKWDEAIYILYKLLFFKKLQISLEILKN